MARSAQEICLEIEAKLGFFPPFFEPALQRPDVLENLWQQTLSAYVNNPIPIRFKEKLAAYLARFCTVPYCLMCHSASLKPLGMTSKEVLNFLTTAPLNYEELAEKTKSLQTARIVGWPEQDSDIENAILHCCVAIFLNQDSMHCQLKLREALNEDYYSLLASFLAYNRTALSWAESYPELSYRDDKRVEDNFNSLIEGEPELAHFFENYQGRVLEQASRQSYWLTNENKRVLEEERTRMYSYFDQAPIGFAVVKEPEHQYVMANARYEKLVGANQFSGKSIRDVLKNDEYHTFFDSLDGAYANGIGFVEKERLVKLDLDHSGRLSDVFVSITVEPYRDEHGKTAGLFIILNEVTEQVIARQELLEFQKERETAASIIAFEKAKIENLLQQMPVGVCLLEGPKHIYTFINSKYYELVGGHRDILGKTLIEALPEIKGTALSKLLDDVYVTGVPFYGNEYSVALEQASGSPNLKYLNFSYEPMFDAQKRVYGISITATDVTEQVVARKRAEHDEAEFRDLANSMPQIVWTAMSDGMLDYFNQVWFDYSGSTQSDNAFNGWTNKVHPEDLELTVKRWQDSITSGQIYENEFRLRAANGSYRWFVARAVPTRNSQGSVVKWYGTNTDIQYQKLLTQDLEKARKDIESEQQKFRTIFADSSASMAVLRGPDFIYEIANKSYLELFSNRDLIEKSFTVALPELIGTVYPQHAKSVFETGVSYVEREARAFLKRTDVGVLEERFFDQTYSRMSDQENKPYGVFIHAQEVTDRVRARLELAQAAERFGIAVETANMGTWDLDPQSGMVHWSKRTRELFGASQDEDVTLDVALKNIHQADVGRVSKAIADANDPVGNGSYAIQYRIVKEDGSIRWVSVLGKAFFSNTPAGRVSTKFTGNVLDITDQIVAEAALREAKDKAEAANIAKSSFLANMSHEIRTPLGAIMGFAELIADPKLSKESLVSYSSVIIRNSSQLLRIIDDILDLSKVEAGKFEIENISFSLREVIADISSLLGLKAREKSISFSVTNNTPIPNHVISDPTRLRQILINVVGNAIKFTEGGTVSITTSFVSNKLIFKVSDTGRGISTEQVQKLFQPFSQADSATNRKFGGSGLGLILTKNLCQAMGGDFYLAESTIGKGSTFIAEILVKTPDNTTFTQEVSLKDVYFLKKSPSSSLKVLEGMKVLLVEDSPDNQELIKIILTNVGAIVDVASDGIEGIEMAASSDYSAVLMDVQMPRMDGYEATKTLRKRGFDKPIIALTAHAMKTEKEKILSSGFSYFLPKPLQQDALIALLKTLHAVIDNLRVSAKEMGTSDAVLQVVTAKNVLVIDDDPDIGDLLTAFLSNEKYTVKVAESAEQALNHLQHEARPDIILLDLSLPNISGDKLLEILNLRSDRHEIKIIITSGWDNLESRAAKSGADGFMKKPLQFNKLSDLLSKFTKKQTSFPKP